MSPRRNIPRRTARDRRRRPDDEEPALRLVGGTRLESASDGEWAVRPVSGQAAVKRYRCPGCAQDIPSGMAHIVAWPADTGDADARRHWHTSCWEKRLHRRTRHPRR